ncbi:uncharacterized protein O3C94_002987 [Discoglossus pictus]
MASKGGLAVPDLLKYYKAARLAQITKWFDKEHLPVWVEIEKDIFEESGLHIKQKHHCKSHSHILSLSLLLLLAAGDISPNPGPSLISTYFQPRSTPRAENTRKTQNLIPITCHKPSTLPFSCALWNARSICNKLTFTHDLFTTNSLNLLALTETWLSSSDTASPAALSHGGFHLSHTPRPGNKQGGGVGVLLSSRCTFHLIPPVPSLQFSSFEAHTIRLFSPISLRVAVIYRPPGTSSQFLDHFSAWLPHFLSSNIPTLILGDFNIAIDTPTSSAAAKLLALTSSLGLSQLTDSSTHHVESSSEGKDVERSSSRGQRCGSLWQGRHVKNVKQH